MAPRAKPAHSSRVRSKWSPARLWSSRTLSRTRWYKGPMEFPGRLKDVPRKAEVTRTVPFPSLFSGLVCGLCFVFYFSLFNSALCLEPFYIELTLLLSPGVRRGYRRKSSVTQRSVNKVCAGQTVGQRTSGHIHMPPGTVCSLHCGSTLVRMHTPGGGWGSQCHHCGDG